MIFDVYRLNGTKLGFIDDAGCPLHIVSQCIEEELEERIQLIPRGAFGVAAA